MNNGKWKNITSKQLDKVRKMKEEGRTDKEISKYLNINYATFYKWKKEKEELKEALIIGENVVVEKVKNRLIDLCLGFNYNEVKQKQETRRDKNGNILDRKDIQEVTVKKVLPSIQAIVFYLKNKCPDEFVDIMELKGGIDNEEGNAGTLFDNLEKFVEEMDAETKEDIKK